MPVLLMVPVPPEPLPRTLPLPLPAPLLAPVPLFMGTGVDGTPLPGAKLSPVSGELPGLVEAASGAELPWAITVVAAAQPSAAASIAGRHVVLIMAMDSLNVRRGKRMH